MIARYPGPCKNCGVTIQKGEDCWYESDTRTIAHHVCPVASDKPSPDAFQLADSLGFIKHGEPLPYAEWRLWKVKAQAMDGRLF